MTDVPKDIYRSAYDAALSYRHEIATNPRLKEGPVDPIHNDDVLIAHIAAALLAERERRTPDVVADLHARLKQVYNNLTPGSIERADLDGMAFTVREAMEAISIMVAALRKIAGDTYDDSAEKVARSAIAGPSLSSGAGRSEERG